jgi:hypothetical protein
MKPNEENWSVEVSSNPGTMYIVKNGVDSKGAVYDINGHLNWCSLVKCIEDALQRVLKSVVDSKFCIEKSNQLSSLRLSVTYLKHSIEKKLYINLIPALDFDEKRFVPAVKSCQCPTQDPELQELGWRVTNFQHESASMDRFGRDFTGHRRLLKIVKAICLNFPLQFGQLTSYHYKTVLLHILDDQSDKSEWSDSALSERFIDYLVELGSCCKEKKLMNYYDSCVNLFDDVSPESLQNLALHVNRILGRNDFESLLAERSYEKL